MESRSIHIQDELPRLQVKLEQLEATHSTALAQCFALVRQHLGSLEQQTAQFPAVQQLVRLKTKRLLTALCALTKSNSRNDNSSNWTGLLRVNHRHKSRGVPLEFSGSRSFAFSDARYLCTNKSGVEGTISTSRSSGRIDTGTSLESVLQLAEGGSVLVSPCYDNEKLLQKLRELLTDKERRLFKLEAANTRLLTKLRTLFNENSRLVTKPQLSLFTLPDLALPVRNSATLKHVLSQQILRWKAETDQVHHSSLLALASFANRIQALQAKTIHLCQTLPRAALIEERSRVPRRIPGSLGKLWQRVEQLVYAQDMPRLMRLVSEVRRSNFPSAETSRMPSRKESFSTVEGLILGLHTPSRHYLIEDDTFLREGSLGSPPEISLFDASSKSLKVADPRLEVIQKQLETISSLRDRLQDYEGLRERLKHARFLAGKIAPTLSPRNTEGQALFGILQAILKDSHN